MVLNAGNSVEKSVFYLVLKFQSSNAEILLLFQNFVALNHIHKLSSSIILDDHVQSFQNILIILNEKAILKL